MGHVPFSVVYNGAVANKKADLQNREKPGAVDPRARNALKHGLTAKHVHEAELAAFEAAFTELVQTHAPVGPHELALCKRIAHLTVRLGRAGELEGELFAACYEEGAFDQLAFERLVHSIGRYERAIARSLAKTGHELERLINKRSGDPVAVPSIVDFNW